MKLLDMNHENGIMLENIGKNTTNTGQTMGSMSENNSGCMSGMAEKFRKIWDNHTFILKLVTGFCVIQGIAFIITSATLGAVIKSNTDAIAALNQQTDTRNALNSNKPQGTAHPGDSSGQLQLSTLEEVESFIQNQSIKIFELELDRELDRDLIEKQGDLITRLESDIEKYGGRLARLEIATNTIDDNVGRLDDHDTEIESAVESIMENSDSVIDLGQQILNLDLDTESVFTNRERINELDLNLRSLNESIQQHNVSLVDIVDRIVDLESDRVIIRNNSETLATLDTTVKSATLDIRMQNNSITDLDRRLSEQEATNHVIQNNSDRIAELDLDIMTVNSIIIRQNDTINDIDKRTADFEALSAMSHNDSRFLLELSASIQKHNTSIADFEIRTSKLETNISTLQNVSDKISELDVNLGLITSVHQYYNTTLTDIGTRVDDLESNTAISNITLFSAIVQEHNNTLADISKRLDIVEANASTYNGMFSDLDSSMNSLFMAIQSSNTLMTNLVGKVIEMQSNVSLIQNNTNRLDQLDLQVDLIWIGIQNNSDRLDLQNLHLENITTDIIELYALLGDKGNSSTSLGAFTSPFVGFTVHQPDSTLPNISSTVIVFEKVAYNEMECFDTASGKFVTQFPGFYMFTLTIVRDVWPHQASCFICVNKDNNEDCTIRAVANNADTIEDNHPSGTATLVVQLDAGNEVYVSQCNSVESIHQWSSFSGALITLS